MFFFLFIFGLAKRGMVITVAMQIGWKSFKYDVVKLAILKAYELIPEAYRQQFRTRKRNASQQYVEFARDREFFLIDGVLLAK